MAISDDKIKLMENISKIELSDNEKNFVYENIKFLTADFDRLENIETEGIEPFIYAVNLTNIMREDKQIQTVEREEILKNAPDRTEEYVKVPKTLDSFLN